MKHLILTIAILLNVNLVLSQEKSISQDVKVNNLVYGTLLKPAIKSNAVVIIIGGSGPTDRNGNQQMMQNNSLKMLAQDLAKEGIASFRYDKRIFTLLKQNALQEDKLRFDNFIEDAVSTINYFREKKSFQKIYVLGHSQGALVGLIAAQQTKVDGYISIAGAGQSIDQVIVNQIGLQMPKLKEETQEAFTTLREKGKVKDFNPALTSILRPSVQPFILSWMHYDPAVELKKLTIPVLLVNGTKDIQVDQQEAQVLKNALAGAQLELIENMNHVLKTITGGDLENAKSYNDTTLPLSQELVPVVKEFVIKN